LVVDGKIEKKQAVITQIQSGFFAKHVRIHTRYGTKVNPVTVIR